MAEVEARGSSSIEGSTGSGGDSIRDVYYKVKDLIIKSLDIEEKDQAKIVPEADFQKDLGADSLDTVEIIMEAEDAFGIEIPDEKSQQISTVYHAVRYIYSAANGLECDLTEADESGLLELRKSIDVDK